MVEAGISTAQQRRQLEVGLAADVELDASVERSNGDIAHGLAAET